MVGRSKPQKKMEPKQSVDFNTAEITYLKVKNVELAKALSDSKAAYTHIVEDRDLIQREAFAKNLRCTKLENYIKNMESASRALMNAVVIASNHATDIIQIAHNALRMKIRDDSIRSPMITNSLINGGSPHSSPSSNKTQAVKPMIGGHVILRPTINLRRVNEIPLEEIRRLQYGDNNTSQNNSETNISSSDDNQNQDDSPTRLRIFRNQQQQQQAVEPFNGTNNETEDEYTDQTSEISDIPSEPINRLDTVQEDEEENNTSSSLPNTTNGTSLNLSGSSSQIPLLSGVFRDVKVYLSPMQNVAQYLDRHQNVTERGSSKTHKTSRSHNNSLYSGRFNDNNKLRSSTSSGENRNNNNQVSSTSTSNTSLEDSFTASLGDSLLSSTRIAATPSRIVTSTAQQPPDDLNWLNGSNKSDDFRNNGLSLNGMKRKQKQNSFASKSPDHSGSSNSGSNKGRPSITSDDDPLEGPSNMLDSFDQEIRNKIETMSSLGLTPTFLDNSKKKTKPPASPANTVLQRRENRKSDEKTKKSFFVTKRAAIEKKKTSIVSSKVAKVIVKRLSLTKTHHLESPQINNSQRKSSLDNSQKSLNKSNSQKNSSSGSLNVSRGRPRKKSQELTPKKRGRKSKGEVSQLEQTQSSVNSDDTPRRKRGRPKRGATQISLKEPSLRKKLRRSK